MPLKTKSFQFPNASLILSPSALSQSANGNSHVVVVLWYRTVHLFLIKSKYETHGFAKINREIITASVRPEPKKFFSEPVQLS